jgi:hypothetical protein
MGCAIGKKWLDAKIRQLATTTLPRLTLELAAFMQITQNVRPVAVRQMVLVWCWTMTLMAMESVLMWKVARMWWRVITTLPRLTLELAAFMQITQNVRPVAVRQMVQDYWF